MQASGRCADHARMHIETTGSTLLRIHARPRFSVDVRSERASVLEMQIMEIKMDNDKNRKEFEELITSINMCIERHDDDVLFIGGSYEDDVVDTAWDAWVESISNLIPVASRERSEFEEFINKTFGLPVDRYRLNEKPGNPGEYKDTIVRTSWIAWQTAQKFARINRHPRIRNLFEKKT